MADEAQPQQKKPSKLLGNLALLLSIGGTGCIFVGPFGAMAGVALAIVAIVLEVRAPERHAGGGAAMAAILVGAGGIFFWYSQGPFYSSGGVLRSRGVNSSGTETVAIGNLRVLASAETAYESAVGVGYGDPECLLEPRKCAPTLPADTVPFLIDKTLFSKAGNYVITFHPGPKSTENSFQTYAAVSVPRIPGETGRRAFCIDSTGVLRVSKDGSQPPVTNGLCAESTPVLP